MFFHNLRIFFRGCICAIEELSVELGTWKISLGFSLPLRWGIRSLKNLGGVFPKVDRPILPKLTRRSLTTLS